MENPEFNKVLDKMRETHDKKNSDYASETDPYLNFRGCERGGIPAYKGCYVRLTDKFSRISNFIKKESFEVKDESFEDTCIDMANYSILLLLLYKEYKSNETKGN